MALENKHSTTLKLVLLFRTYVWAFTLKVSHAPILVECLFSTTLLRGGGQSMEAREAVEIGRSRF